MSDKKIRLVFKEELCICCHACETACRTWRNVENGIKWRKVIAVEKGEYPAVRIRYQSVSCMHCDDPECEKACPVGAIDKLSSGEVLVDSENCIGCQNCASVCDIPEFGEDGKMQKCDLCCFVLPECMRFPCARMCPTGALSIVTSSD